MNRQAKKAIESIFIISLFIFALLSVFVFAELPQVLYTTIDVQTAENGTFANATEDVVNFYNISLNWTNVTIGATVNNNVSQVNISLPINFTFFNNVFFQGTTNGTSANGNFSNTSNFQSYENISNVLSWSNFSGILVNASKNASFWFNATASTAGWFNITVTIVNGTGSTYSNNYYNLSVFVNDTNIPVINVTGANVGRGITLASGRNYSGQQAGGNYTLNITATEDTPSFMKFVIYNATSAINANFTGIINNRSGYFEHPLNISGENLYNITIWLNDSNNKVNKTVVFTSIRFDNTPPRILNANISSPTSGGNYSQNLVFNVTGVDNSSIIGFWNTTNTSAFGNTNGTFEAGGDGFNSRAVVTINTTSYGDGYYNFSFIANDTAGNNNYTYASAAKVVSVVIDNTPPAVTLTKNTASTTTSNFVVNIATTDWPSNVSGTCTHDQGGGVGSVSGSGAGTQTFTRTGLNCGNSVTVQITCNDYAGNSRTRSITGTTNSCTGGDAGSGGGGGGGTSTVSWSNTFAEDDKPLSEKGEVSKSLGGKQRVKLKVVGETHYVGVASLTASTATIEVSSTPQQATLQVGDERKFDINSDGTSYDLYVKLNAIKNNKADLIIKQISEEITTAEAEEQQQAEGEAAGIAGGEQELGQVSNVSGKTIVIVIVVLVIIALVVFFVLKNKKKF